MRTTGFVVPGLLLSLLVTACAPATDTGTLDDADGEQVGSAAQAITFTDQIASANDADFDEDGDLDDEDEHCLVPADLIDDFPKHRQVRLLRTETKTTETGTVTLNHLALCTVFGESDSGRLELSTSGLAEKLGAADANGTVTGVTIQTLNGLGHVTNNAGAIGDLDGGFSQDIREYAYYPEDARVAYAAPHGRIEKKTVAQVERIFNDKTYPRDAFWAAGYHTTAGTLPAHLHITSADISEVSFPGLEDFVMERTRYAVSFHGFDDSDEDVTFTEDVLVGGTETALFRKGVAEILNDALAGTGFVARHDLTPDAYRRYRGNDPDNFVNRMAKAGGLQLEQSLSMRDDATAANKVADAVKSVYDCLLDSPDQTITTRASYPSGGTGYTAGKCARYIGHVNLRSSGTVTVTAGMAPGCSGGKVHVDVYRLTQNLTWTRIGGGWRTFNSSCVGSNDAGFDVPPVESAYQQLRVVVQAKTNAGAAAPAIITVN